MSAPELTALKNMPISFPGLFGDWEFNPDPVAFHVGHGVYWYGIILALGFLAGLLLCMKQAKRYGLTEDHVLDFVLWAVPCCILGSRIYYVVFYLDLYRNEAGGLDWGRIVAIWDGGIAIYGTVIAGALVAFFFTRWKKIKLGAMADLCVMGLLLGQIIGRWANFVNREAFGGPTDLPWRMRVWTSASEYVEVHPTFFYESLWNLIGLLLILFVVSRGRRFDGENTWFYFLWYGLGRTWIEGLRTDSLYLFDWTLFGQPIRVSQALSAVMVAAAVLALFYELKIKRHGPEDLLVNQIAAKAAEGEAGPPKEEQP
nr:prolipoprotein diacylglyceryl transferase [uncultured Oscillibacter sp.]